MKKIVFNTFITAAALATAVCAYLTLPEGHALNKQGKLALVGLDDTCKKCEPGAGTNCDYHSYPKKGGACIFGQIWSETFCDGSLGSGLVYSPTDSAALGAPGKCKVDKLVCSLQVGGGAKWVSEPGYPKVPKINADCGWYSTCTQMSRGCPTSGTE